MDRRIPVSSTPTHPDIRPNRPPGPQASTPRMPARPCESSHAPRVAAQL
ncbi:MAG: hypothetical protein WCP70_13575 [Methanothrix sp.]